MSESQVVISRTKPSFDRVKFGLICASLACVAVVGIVCYTMLQIQANSYEAAKQEIERKARAQFDDTKARLKLSTCISQTFGHRNYELEEKFPLFIYSSTSTHEVFRVEGRVRIKFQDVGWKQCTYFATFSPSGTLEVFDYNISEPASPSN